MSVRHLHKQKRWFVIGLAVLAGLCFPGCQSIEPPLSTTAPSQFQELTSPTQTASPKVVAISTSTPAPAEVEESAVNLPTAVPTSEPESTQNLPRPTPTLSADDPAFDGTTIEELTDRVYGSGWFSFTETITRNVDYHQYTFEYLSDGHVVEGFLTIPAGTGDYGEKFPVLFLLHGYVDPTKYEIFPYSTRYVMPFVEEGYMVIHPSYRGHSPRPDSNWNNRFRIEYAIDVLNLLAMVREGSADLAGPFRRADAENIFLWGHSMGGGITQRVLTVRPDWVSGAALYASMSGDEKRNYERIREWGDERTWRVEYFAPQEIIETVSPIYFLDRWEAPVTIHHGDADEIVPPEWSVELCAELKAIDHPVECYQYVDYGHNLFGSGEKLFEERVIAFFEKYQR